MPLRVGNIKPVKVCISKGTPAINAATIINNPDFETLECTINGFSLVKIIISLNKHKHYSLILLQQRIQYQYPVYFLLPNF